MARGFEQMGDLERAAKTPDFNERHPEIGRTEVFLGNFRRDGFDGIGFKKKRMGTRAFDHFGRPTEDIELHPVFVDRDEYAPTAAVVRANKAILDRDPAYQKDQEELWKQDRKS